MPYLKHAESLVSTETATAKEEKKKKDDILYIVEGAASPAKTPLASPIFLIEIDKLNPERLGLYKLETKNGRREILFNQKKPPKPIRMEVSRLADKLYRLEVGRQPGERRVLAQSRRVQPGFLFSGVLNR